MDRSLLLSTFYGLVHDGYEDSLSCELGDEVAVERAFDVINPSPFQSVTSISLNELVTDSLYGIAFTVVYDTTFFYSVSTGQARPPFEDSVATLYIKHLPGKIEYAASRLDRKNEYVADGRVLLGLAPNKRYRDMWPGQRDTTVICVANIRGILSDGTEFSMGSNPVNFIFWEPGTTNTKHLETDGLRVYPNPSTGNFEIVVPDALLGADCLVYDASGIPVLSNRLSKSQSKLELPPGVYTLIVQQNEGPIVKRIVVINP
jgi:hypothetical protein